MQYNQRHKRYFLRHVRNQRHKKSFLRDIRALFESDDDDYYKPIRTVDAFGSNCIEYKSNSVKKNLCLLKNILVRLDHIKRYNK